MFTAAVAALLIKYPGNEFYIYICGGGIIFGIGSLISAINSNLREIYSTFLFFGGIMYIIFPYFSNHKIIVTIVDIWLAIGCLASCKDSIDNIRNGIDIDIVREKEEEMRKLEKGFRLVKALIWAKRWFFSRVNMEIGILTEWICDCHR